MKKIAASILGIDNKTKLVNDLIDRGIEYIHYDVMDSKFVDNWSLPVDELKEIIKNTKNHIKDIHLMVELPGTYIEELSGIADQISVHYESSKELNITEFVDKYSKVTKLGLVLNPDTPVENIFEYLPKLNHILIMSVVPGKGGQAFIEDALDKVKNLKNEIKRQGLSTIIEIDGGINDKWGPKAFNEGVDIAVSGSYLINNIDSGSIEKILK